MNPQTLRYYERRGLLPESERSPTRYRAYGAQALRIVRFIKRAQELGFSFDDGETLLELADGGPEGCEPTRAIAVAKVADLDARTCRRCARCWPVWWRPASSVGTSGSARSSG